MSEVLLSVGDERKGRRDSRRDIIADMRGLRIFLNQQILLRVSHG